MKGAASIAEGRIPGEVFLHSPGPTHLPAEVLNAMDRQPLEHGDPRLETLITSCETGLRRVLRTERSPICLYAANGHGAWASAIENLLAPGQKVLVAIAGLFSEFWALQVEGSGRQVVRTPLRNGYPTDPADVERVLRADSGREIVAVFSVHTDTASGCTNDLRAIRSAIDAAKHPALYVVDVISSLAATPFDMDELGVDVAIGASQKGLMCPTGLAFVAFDERARAIAKQNAAPRYYWDWERRLADPNPYVKFGGSPPQNMLFGLSAALDLLFREGLPAVYARHAMLARAVHAAVECWSREGAMSLHCREPAARSLSVTTIDVREGVDIEALRTTARERFQIAFPRALGAQRSRAFRIGHLGDLNQAMLLGCLTALEAAMTTCGIPYGTGGAQAAGALLASAARP